MKSTRNIYTIILAGGSGTRFWPLSRKTNPKQFLSIVGRRSLLQETILRIQPIVAKNHIYCVTNQLHRRMVKKQIAGFAIPASHILSEPEGKNTAPAICWAASHIYRRDPEAVMVILPSDHLIQHPKSFLRRIEEAVKLAQENYLVTLGIIPTRPETGYGYLKTKPITKEGPVFLTVQKFTEKPSVPIAQQFLKQGNYLWNSGMFIWKCSVILQEFRKHLPDVCEAFHQAKGTAAVYRIWSSLPNISVDYAILEKAQRVACVPAGDMGWSDLGSWESLAEVLPKDARQNIFKGDVVDVACENILVFAERQKKSRLIAVVGLKDMIVVDTDDALLVCRKNSSQQVKAVVEHLKRKKANVI